MEVSMNGGVGVVQPEKGWQRHLGFGAGAPTRSCSTTPRPDLRDRTFARLVRIIDAKNSPR